MYVMFRMLLLRVSFSPFSAVAISGNRMLICRVLKSSSETLDLVGVTAIVRRCS